MVKSGTLVIVGGVAGWVLRGGFVSDRKLDDREGSFETLYETHKNMVFEPGPFGVKGFRNS